MIYKIFINNIRKNIFEYSVLMISTVFFISIFFMFANITFNSNISNTVDTFLEDNAIFYVLAQIGLFILGIASVIFINYFNNCISYLQQELNALLLILGAEKKKIIIFNYLEIMALFILCIIFGSILGYIINIFLPHIISIFIVVDPSFIKISGSYYAFYTTFLTYLLIFTLIYLLNIYKYSSVSLLNMLDENNKPKSTNIYIKTVFFILGTFLILSSYYILISLGNSSSFKFHLVLYAGVGVTIGTYLLYYTILPFFLTFLSRTNRVKYKKLSILLIRKVLFTIEQYVKTFTLCTIILSFSLGAFMVGQGIAHRGKELLSFTSSDTNLYHIVYKNDEIQDFELEKLVISEKDLYTIKYNDSYVYVQSSDIEKISIKYKLEGNDSINCLSSLLNLNFLADEILVLDSKQFELLRDVNTFNLTALKFEDFDQSYPFINALIISHNLNYHFYFQYTLANQYFSSINMGRMFYFLGLVLSIAFFIMYLAICLIKLLFSINMDIDTYKRTIILGLPLTEVRKKIITEQFFIFLTPLLFSFTNVCFGINIFKDILSVQYTRNLLYYSLPFIFIYMIVTLILICIYRNYITRNLRKRIQI